MVGGMRVQALFDLTGRAAIVTGGGTHLGRAMAEALAELGAAVYLASRDAARCEQVAAELRAAGLDATGLGCRRHERGGGGGAGRPRRAGARAARRDGLQRRRRLHDDVPAPRVDRRAPPDARPERDRHVRLRPGRRPRHDPAGARGASSRSGRSTARSAPTSGSMPASTTSGRVRPTRRRRAPS